LRVFISHSSDDGVAYERLRNSLQSAALDIWDVATLTGGVSLADQLRLQIESCDACVFLVTSNSIASSWCRAELGAFWGAGKLVVIFLDDDSVLESQLPPELAGHYRVTTYEKVIETLATCQSGAQSAHSPRLKRIQGRRLFQYPGYYPIDLEPGTNRPLANRDTYAKAVEYLLDPSRFDRLAAMDLVYLRADNLLHGPTPNRNSSWTVF